MLLIKSGVAFHKFRIYKTREEVEMYHPAIFGHCFDLIVLEISENRTKGMGTAMGNDHRFGGSSQGIPEGLFAYMTQVYEHAHIIHLSDHFFPEISETFFSFAGHSFGRNCCRLIHGRSSPFGRIVPGKGHIAHPALVKFFQLR